MRSGTMRRLPHHLALSFEVHFRLSQGRYARPTASGTPTPSCSLYCNRYNR